MSLQRALDPLLAWLLLGAALAFLLSVLTGPLGLGVASGDRGWLILTEIRLPRALLGLGVGAALGASGACLQGYLRNPLAEPGLIGITGGATLGAVLAIHSSLAGAFALALPLGGLAGAAVAGLIVIALASRGAGPYALILAGVAVASLTTALTTIALSLAPNPFATVEITLWLLGSLEDRSLVHVGLALPLIVGGLALLLSTGHGLDALSLGEEAAANLGIDLKRLRLLIVLGSALAVGAATSVTGAIGFVGLIVPHLLRPHVAYQPGRLLLPSVLGGAIFVLMADVLVRLIQPWGDVRLGALTALIGAPFFLRLIFVHEAQAESA